eukprot:TRINITY_DN54468_c0_g1_i1.p1 TRINITY_DN54468_c0_g1~~TRINITY_DN54468_c0_g1_i1.p1  ORF type:complete len:385 (+),score=87.66 TRINITY_DN54468_c0_g1_i1:25-1179(+)
MFTAPVRVAPKTEYIAEVVVLVTTFGAKRSEFNAGKRARDLLEIKGVHHKIIDFNRDARQAGTGEAENKAIQKLMMEGKLQTGDNKDLTLPQVFIDGQFVGNASDLQGLEDDALLENILLRKACMKCNDQSRTPEMPSQCKRCWEKFQEILPGLMTLEQALQEFARLNADEFDDDDEDYEEDEAYIAECEQITTRMPVESDIVEVPDPPLPSTGKAGEWQVKTDAGWTAFLPGVKFVGLPGEQIRWRHRLTDGQVFDMQAEFHSSHVGTQTNLVTRKERPLQRVRGCTGGPSHASSEGSQAEVARSQSLRAGYGEKANKVPEAPLNVEWAAGDKVQYWSDSKNRWVDAIVDGVRLKDGKLVYDLNCKTGAKPDKLKAYDNAPKS